MKRRLGILVVGLMVVAITWLGVCKWDKGDSISAVYGHDGYMKAWQPPIVVIAHTPENVQPASGGGDWMGLSEPFPVEGRSEHLSYARREPVMVGGFIPPINERDLNPLPAGASTNGILSSIVRMPPKYPDSMMAAGMEGTVVVKFDLQSGGDPWLEPTRPMIVNSGGEEFDQAVLNAMPRAWRYAPVKLGDEQQSIELHGIHQAIYFRLLNDRAMLSPPPPPGNLEIAVWQAIVFNGKVFAMTEADAEFLLFRLRDVFHGDYLISVRDGVAAEKVDRLKRAIHSGSTGQVAINRIRNDPGTASSATKTFHSTKTIEIDAAEVIKFNGRPVSIDQAAQLVKVGGVSGPLVLVDIQYYSGVDIRLVTQLESACRAAGVSQFKRSPFDNSGSVTTIVNANGPQRLAMTIYTRAKTRVKTMEGVLDEVRELSPSPGVISDVPLFSKVEAARKDETFELHVDISGQILDAGLPVELEELKAKIAAVVNRSDHCEFLLKSDHVTLGTVVPEIAVLCAKAGASVIKWQNTDDPEAIEPRDDR